MQRTRESMTLSTLSPNTITKHTYNRHHARDKLVTLQLKQQEVSVGDSEMIGVMEAQHGGVHT